MHVREVAIQAARAGGAIVADCFLRDVTVRSKARPSGSHDLVCEADIRSEAAIAQSIFARFPDHQIMGEESCRGDRNATHLWIVDPLDGTNNFAHQVPHVAVSVAYYHEGTAQIGVIFNPLTDDLFVAQRGAGAFYNERRAEVGKQTRLDQVLVGVGFYYDRGAMMRATLRAMEDLFGQNIHGIRRFGTASLDLCNVGIGRFGVYFEYELSPWDFAAGALFVQEAGGTVTTCQGEPLPIEATSVMASNGMLHPQALGIVRAHVPE